VRFWLLPCLLAACATPPAPPEPQEFDFAQAYLTREANQAGVEPAPRPSLSLPPPADPFAGLVAPTPELRAVAADDAKLDAELATPVTRAELEVLAALRAVAVRAAQARYEAARTGYGQARDLKDLVAIYRAFVRETRTRVGPEKSRRATGAIAPHPNIDAISAEIVRRTIDIAREEWRAVVVKTVAMAGRAHADAARLVAVRRIVAADVELHRRLVGVVMARFEAGRGDQAGLLAFQARLDELRARLDVLDRESTAIRARWNLLLHRPESATIALGVAPAEPDEIEPVPDGSQRPRLRVAQLAAERAGLAVRLAETMNLPRMDLGTSRLEHERAADVFPEPGRMVRPRADFGVREAQVAELRERRVAAELAAKEWSDQTATDIRQARFAYEAAARNLEAYAEEVVPKARLSYQSASGSYEAGRTGYIELLESARRLLRARLAEVDARRDAAHARARLLEAAGRRNS